ncbi:MAG: phosphate ABC transporter permease PstA [Gammaproteobacteria bacterium]|nr:phosphate ABC transporter permease PstA [Gammaproteobacteria bacterium]NND55603.1 phosphate ABC transporter permease PstA [Gammaproteobacteria bacterium]
MAEEQQQGARRRSSTETRSRVEASLKRRYRREQRFKIYGVLAVLASVSFVAFFFISIVSQGYTAFTQTYMQLDVELDPDVIDPDGGRAVEQLSRANYGKLTRAALAELFPGVSGRKGKRELKRLISTGAPYDLRDRVVADPELIGTSQSIWFIADDEVDAYVKTSGKAADEVQQGRLSDQQVAWIDELIANGRIEKRFNRVFFTSGDSRDPELAGIWAAAKGSFFMLIVCMGLAFPLGVAAAIYLEEFAPRNRWVDLIEVNINNLAAVPSIVFGLLGLAVFINFLSLPRSAPLVGGLVLALMTLPTIIIASRGAITAVPPSIREAALGLGASQVQAVTHHVLPLAMPGMLTGAILGLARALGETAPLLMIGMVAFVVEAPQTPLDPSSALPVQIFLWADSPERAFAERTGAAIMVLLGFLLVMNASAVWLRSKYERRW